MTTTIDNISMKTTLIMNSATNINDVTAPPPSYANTMTTRIKSFFVTSTPTFTIPNDFDTASQKGFKSNSWFSTTEEKNQSEHTKTIRRVASAPNAKLFNKTKKNINNNNNYNNNVSTISIPSLMTEPSSPLQRLHRSCRRTYSSSSIKVKKIEVGPSSFTKIRMLGKGDVGRVYMVKQKETEKLYAMKG